MGGGGGGGREGCKVLFELEDMDFTYTVPDSREFYDSSSVNVGVVLVG